AQAPAELFQNLIGLAAARLGVLQQALQLGGRDNFLDGFPRVGRRPGGGWGRGGGLADSRVGAPRAGRGGGGGGGRRLRRRGLGLQGRGVHRLRLGQLDMGLRDGEGARRRRGRGLGQRRRRRRRGDGLGQRAPQQTAGKQDTGKGGEEYLGFHGSHRDGQTDQKCGAFS